MKKNNKKSLISLIFTFSVILIVLVIAVWNYSEVIVLNSFKSELRWSNEIVLATINPGRITRSTMLIGDTQEMLVDEDTLWLKSEAEKMTAVFKDKGVDSVYILVKKGADIYFLVDATPIGDELYIEPGTIYRSSPITVFNVFDKKEESFSDVYTDEYGEYFSLFTPIFDEDNELIAVLGSDVDYGYFKSKLNTTKALMLLMLFVLLFFALYIILYIRKKESIVQRSKDNETKIKSLIDSIPNALAVYDKNEIIDLWNLAAKDMFKSGEKDAVGKKIGEMLKYDKIFELNTENEIKNFKFFSKENITSRILEFRITNDKSEILILESIFAYMEISGETFCIALFNDISNRKIKEFEIERQKNKLEKLNSLMIDRELKMVDLKNKINKLQNE